MIKLNTLYEQHGFYYYPMVYRTFNTEGIYIKYENGKYVMKWNNCLTGIYDNEEVPLKVSKKSLADFGIDLLKFKLENL